MEIKNLESNIWKYYVFNFLTMFVIYLPFIVYYFQELGFNLGQIAILQSVMAITLLVFEIPSGYIADKFGRKNSLILSSIFRIVSMSLLFSAESYFLLVLSHVFLGASNAFISGADSAFLYDTLLMLKKENEYKKKEGKAKFFAEIAIIISAVLGSFMISFGIYYTILISIIAQIILLLILLTLREPKLHRKIEAIPLKKEIIKIFHIIKQSLYNKKLMGFFIYSFVVLGVSNTIFSMYQPYFRATELPLFFYGIIFAVFSVFTAFASLKAHDIEHKLGMYKSLLIMPLFLVIALIGSSMFFVWIGLIFFFFRELVRGFIFPVLGDYVNKIAKSEERATVLSILSIFSRLGLVVIVTSFGFFSDSYGLQHSLFVTGIALLGFTILAVLFVKFKLNKNVIKGN